MKTIFLLGVLCMGTLMSYAQVRTKVDSLQQLLTQMTKEDTVKADALLELAETYRGINLDTSYTYAVKAYKLASSLQYKSGMARADKNKGNYFLFTGVTDSAVFYFKKSQDLSRKIGDLSGVHDIDYNLGLLYMSISEYDKSIKHYDKDFKYRKQIQDTLGIADGLMNIGVVHTYKGDNKNAFEYLSASIPYFEQGGDLLSVAKANYNLGTIQWNYSNYDLALNNFFSSLKAFEKEGNHYLLASCFENIAGIYMDMGNHQNAVKYYKRSMQYSEASGDTRLTASNYHSMARVMESTNQIDSAYYFLGKSLKLSKEGGFKDILSLNYHSQGVFIAKEDPTKAIGLLNKSITLKKELDFDKYNIATSLFELGKIHMDQGLVGKAKETFEEGWEVSRQTDSKDIKSQLSMALYNLHKRSGSEKRALPYLEEYQVLRDSIFDEETAKSVVAREIQYETAKKDQQIQLLTQETALQEAEMKTQEALVNQRSTQRNLLLWGTSSLIVIFLLLFRNYKIKLRSRAVINKKQQEFVNLRSRFFANISHEFRTPLTLILGPLKDMLSSDREDDEHKRSYELMKRNGERLLDLVNQLLDLAKLESGNMPLKVRETAIGAFLNTLTASFTSLASFQNISFKTTIDPAIKLGWVDEDKLEKIVNNLLSNAFKFTPEKGVVQVVAVPIINDGKAKNGKNNYLKITVMDSGKGIPASELKKVFDRFYQVDDSVSKERSGTGIGLALTKELVEVHHGEVFATSEAGKGSVFTVILPIDKECYNEDEVVAQDEQFIKVHKPIFNTKPEDVEAEINGAPIKKGLPQLLVVEDNKDIRTYIKKQLQDEYSVTEAIHGEDGLKKAVKNIPDLIISDVMMPKVDGMELCAKLKQDERTSHIPIILLTAMASQTAKIKGIETGADDYIIKPFDREELRVRVKNLIAQRKQLRERYSRQVTLQPKDIAVTSTDERFLEKVIQILEEHLDDSAFSVADFGREIGMSRTQLFRKMQALTNQSASDFIRDFRLKRAAYLLKNKVGNVSEVAYQVGFGNLSYFAKCFKELFGKAPSEYLGLKV